MKAPHSDHEQLPRWMGELMLALPMAVLVMVAVILGLAYLLRGW